MAEFWSSPIGWTIITVAHILAVTVVLLLTIAFIIYGDRKIFAGVQARKGPNVVGPFGLLHSSFPKAFFASESRFVDCFGLWGAIEYEFVENGHFPRWRP